MVRRIYQEHDGDFTSESTLNFVTEFISSLEFMQNEKTKRDWILNLYPDCQDIKMSDQDPRKNYLNKHVIGQLPLYAFPLGFNVKYEIDRP